MLVPKMFSDYRMFVPEHVGVDGGVCTQCNLYRTNHIKIHKQHSAG